MSQDEIALTAPIVQVTLLEDRAYIVRQGKAEVPQGASRLRVSEVSPVLADKTATARVVSPEAIRVLDVQALRSLRIVPEARPEALAELSGQRHQLQAQQATLESERTLLSGELKSARQLISQLIAEIAEDAAWGRAEAAAWGERLDGLEEWEGQLALRQSDIDSRLEQLKSESKALDVELERRRGLEKRFGADLLLAVDASQAGEAEFRLEYCVPGACWRPYHAAHLSSQENSLEFRCDGSVWQNTGEEWEDVQLLFSTRRPSLGSSPPPLSPDRLALQKKTSEAQVVSRDQEVKQAGLSLSDTVSLERPTATDLPGIDDGGEVLLLTAPHRCTVPSDGRATRVGIFQFRVDTSIQRVLLAEMSREVFCKSLQSNSSTYPILAGPVDLIRDSGLVGRGQILFVAPGEPFALNWGPDPLLRAQRKATRSKEEKSDLMGSWLHAVHTITLFLGNLGTDPKEILVTERIPVSEVKLVEISQDVEATSEKQKADENGFIRWTVQLGPRGRAERKLVYTLNRRKDVVGV